jgi:uncharacterized protein (DUF305 family)
MKTNTLSTKKLLAPVLAVAAIATTVGPLGAIPAFAQSASGTQHEHTQSGGSEGSMKMHMTMQESQKKMSEMQMSGDTDRDFAIMMREHHQHGIDMAKAEVDAGKDPEMVKEAKKIIASQQKDIQKFDAWLKKHPAK